MPTSNMATSKQTNSPGDYEVQRLGQLCLPRWYDRIRSVVVRPERPEFAVIMTGQPANPRWARALDQMHQAIKSYDRDEQQQQQGMSPMDAFFEGLEAFHYPNDKAKPILGAIGKSKGTPAPHLELPERGPWTKTQAYKNLIEHMLLIDYDMGYLPVRATTAWRTYLDREGLRALTGVCAYLAQFAERCRNGQLPPLKEWQALASTLLLPGCESELASEIALAMYHCHTHRQDMDMTTEQAGFELGMTGYTGIIEELIDEIPFCGPDRLLRKLSVDVHVLIPQCCDIRIRSELTAAAEALADEHDLSIYEPKIKGVEIPPFDVTHRDGYTKQEKETRGGAFAFGKYYFPGLPTVIRRRPGSWIDTRFLKEGLWEYSDAENAARLAADKKEAAKYEYEARERWAARYKYLPKGKEGTGETGETGKRRTAMQRTLAALDGTLVMALLCFFWFRLWCLCLLLLGFAAGFLLGNAWKGA